MYELENNLLYWFAEFAIRLALFAIFQFFAVSFVVNVAHLKVTLPVRYIVLISGQIFLIWTGYFAFDPQTHVLGSVFASASVGFISPLRALAYLHQVHTKPSNKQPSRVDMVRIAIPASGGESTCAAKKFETTWTQAGRGILFLITTGACRSLLRDSIALGGIPMDIMVLIVVWGALNAFLNLTSALSSAFGVKNTCPFAHPFFAPSQATFWAGRWNAPVSDALRAGIFTPLVHAGISRSIAIAICFIVSAFAHDILLLYVGVHESRTDWTLFFFCAGVSTLIEKNIPIFQRFPTFQRISGIVVLFALFHFLFAPLTVQTGVALKFVNELSCVEIACRKVFRNLFVKL